MADEAGLAAYKIVLYAQEDGGWVAEIPEIRTVAEGLEGFQGRVSAVFKNLREEFNEVKSMIRLSFR